MNCSKSATNFCLVDPLPPVLPSDCRYLPYECTTSPKVTAFTAALQVLAKQLDSFPQINPDLDIQTLFFASCTCRSVPSYMSFCFSTTYGRPRRASRPSHPHQCASSAWSRKSRQAHYHVVCLLQALTCWSLLQSSQVAQQPFHLLTALADPPENNGTHYHAHQHTAAVVPSPQWKLHRLHRGQTAFQVY